MTEFDANLKRHGIEALRRDLPRTMQINVGKLCNQACHHCHVDAGPKRTERMTLETAHGVMALLAASASIATVDLTGGAPELNPHFRYLVEQARALGREVVVRCNLTVLQVEGMHWLPAFYRAHRVKLVCSLPCYTAANVDQQRGAGVFAASIEALRALNRIGYGRDDPGLVLDLVYNPLGPSLPPAQAELEGQYRGELRAHFGVEFNHLLTIANMPIKRFADQLDRAGRHAEYLGLLVNHFNPATVAGLMCRSLVSIGWDGTLYDCDFNQMLEMPLTRDGHRLTLRDIGDLADLAGAAIATGAHCFGCTAGAGSSCTGAIA